MPLKLYTVTRQSHLPGQRKNFEDILQQHLHICSILSESIIVRNSFTSEGRKLNNKGLIMKEEKYERCLRLKSILYLKLQSGVLFIQSCVL